MTYKSTWSNPDGLVVGFGPHFVERNVGAVEKGAGSMKVAKLHIDKDSVSGASGARIAIPAGSIVKNVYAKVTTTWAGGTSITFGDATTPAGWIIAADFGTPAAGAVIQAMGAYAQTATEGQLPPKEYASATDLYITVTGTYTAGEADIFVELV